MAFGEVMWTEDSETHVGRHNVTPLEVEQVLYSQPRLLIRQLIAGLCVAYGVPLFVWLALREKNGSLWNRSVYGL